LISIVCPTIAGREHWLERCECSYCETTELEHEFIVVRDYPARDLRRFDEQPVLGMTLADAISRMRGQPGTPIALVIRRAGQRHNSPALAANAQHLLTDVWTSVGVLLGVGVVAASGWTWLDPVVALLVAVNITWTGFGILRRSTLGLMDTALPADELAQIKKILDSYRKEEVRYHALRTRQGGARRFVSVHILVPGAWHVQRGHRLLERIEAEIRAALPNVTVLTHLESLEDSASWEDQTLDRG